MNDNPYQPPKAELTPPSENHLWKENCLWRAGKMLIIGNDALLPPICFATGEPTQLHYQFKTVYRPAWLYLLLLAGIFPYFVIAPMYERKVNLKIPVGFEKQKSMRRSAKLSLAFVGTAVLVLLVYLGFAVSIRIQSPFAVFLIVIICLSASLLNSSNMLRLKVVQLEGDYLALSGVHPAILSSLPNFPADIAFRGARPSRVI